MIISKSSQRKRLLRNAQASHPERVRLWLDDPARYAESKGANDSHREGKGSADSGSQPRLWRSLTLYCGLRCKVSSRKGACVASARNWRS